MSQPVTPTAQVVGLWRYPVKSMGGESIPAARLSLRGVHGDRLWAVRDLERDRFATARRLPALLTCAARFTSEPGPGAGPGRSWPVQVTLPDGSTYAGGDVRLDAALSDLTGTRVRLEPLPARTGRREHRGGLRSAAAIRRELGLAADEALPDPSFLDARTLARLALWSTPPGTFADVAGLHLLTTTSLALLTAAGLDGDVRRFRPSVLLEPTGAQVGLDERGWVGGDVAVGGARVSVTMPTIRCVVPGHAQTGGIEEARDLTRFVARECGRFLGVYAEVSTPGDLMVGDAVHLLGGTPSSLSGRLRGSVVRRVVRPALRLGARVLP